jgi:hypothetical protein
LNIRRIQPDWVILRGWGVMNPVALKTAQKVGYPTNKIIGNIWSNSEEDAAPAAMLQMDLFLLPHIHQVRIFLFYNKLKN